LRPVHPKIPNSRRGRVASPHGQGRETEAIGTGRVDKGHALVERKVMSANMIGVAPFVATKVDGPAGSPKWSTPVPVERSLPNTQSVRG
jgi:hypothetical protein